MKNILVCIKQGTGYDRNPYRSGKENTDSAKEYQVLSIHLMHTHWNSQQESKIKNQVRRLH